FLGQLVMREVQRLEAVAAEVACDLGGFASAVRRQPHEYVCRGGVADAIVELRDLAGSAGKRADQFAKTPETAALLRDGDRQQRFTLLADFGPLGHEAQAVEIHVGAAQY